jgi:hypothetical protein
MSVTIFLFFFPFLLIFDLTHSRCRIDPTGEFSRQRQISWLLWTYLKDTSDIIKQELSLVVSTSKAKIHKLELASDVQIGKFFACLFVLLASLC